jgi:hypothetical protein
LTTWTGRTAPSRYGVVVGDHVRRQLDRLCTQAGPLETGGILIGHYSHDLLFATVTEATPAPRDSRCGPSWFNRGFAELRETLDVRWQANPRTHYLGEWHYHPVPDVVPSSVDFAQMAEVSRAESTNVESRY